MSDTLEDVGTVDYLGLLAYPDWSRWEVSLLQPADTVRAGCFMSCRQSDTKTVSQGKYALILHSEEQPWHVLPHDLK